MKKKDYEHIMGVLRELSMFIFERSQEEHDQSRAQQLRSFIFKGTDVPLTDYENNAITRLSSLPKQGFEVSQPNTATTEKTTNSLKTLKGDEELIKLKYGQGCILLRTRLTKKGNVSKYYEGRYYDEYGKQKSVYGRTQKECLKLLREANPVGKNKTKKQKYVTLQEWMLTWYNDFKKASLRFSSRQNYELQMNKYIFPKLGKIKLNALNGEQLQKFVNGIESGNTRKKLLTLISACLNKAVVLKRISSNPCAAVELPKYKKKKRRAFEYDEQNKILAAEDKISQVFFFLCVTGLRVGEFLALTKDDFYFEEGFIKIDKAIVKGLPSEPKTEAGDRIVYFTEELLQNFDISLLGSFTYAGLKTAFTRLLQRQGIKGVSLHSTRHTFATVCHSLGMNDKTLQTLLGHSTLAMTQDVYTHILKKGTSKIYTYLQAFCAHVRTII